jgi:peptidoglycan/xylan/chitin deacetylase (PgdA/CDA1 family)
MAASTLVELVGYSSMAVARGLASVQGGGVIVCGHTLSAAQARFQVEVLGRWFDFIHHDELPARLSRPRGRPFCLLTFDDGKRSNATELAPELERLGVPAAFYVVTRFLSGGRPLWFDRQEALVRALGRTPPGLEQPTLKRLPLDEAQERLDRACAAAGVTLDLASDDVRAMSWDDARALARRGFTIGAHGLHHAIVTNEKEEDARMDIVRSIAEVSRELGSMCVTYAFPNGNCTDVLARHAQAAGAATVMTTEPTWVTRQSALWRLPRVQLFGEQTRSRIELKLAAAATGRLLANPNGESGRRVRALA